MAHVSAYGKKVYLSGPVTGVANFNWEAFEDAARLLYGAQAQCVYNPVARHCNRDGIIVSPVREWECWADYMRDDLSVLLVTERGKDATSNVPYYDWLVSLPGWESSPGAQIERRLAEAAGIECHDWQGIEDDVREQCEFQQKED